MAGPPMTEVEAKQKWCPFAASRVVTLPRNDGNVRGASFGLADGSAETRCIATACMAWRVERVRNTGSKPGGYCGLAGSP